MRLKYLLLILLLIPIAFAVTCEDETIVGDLPCTVVSPYLESFCSDGSYNYTVYNLNDTAYAQNGTMSPVGDFTYNFTFNQTELGKSFSIVLCDNSTSTITIIPDNSSDWEFSIIFVFFCISLTCAMIAMNVKATTLIRTAISLFCFFFSLYMLIFMLGALRLIIQIVSISSTNVTKLLSLIDTSWTVTWYFIYIVMIYFFIEMTKEVILYLIEHKYEKKNKY